MSKFWRRCGIASVSVIVSVSLLFAGAPAALLQPSGNVTVNGSRVDAATAIFPGDKVQTADKSAGDISAPGHMIILAANTDVTYGNGQLEMGCGDALVNNLSGSFKVTSQGFSAQSPNGAPAKFELFQGGGKLRVVVYKGALSVAAPQKSASSLGAGKSMIMAGLTGCASLAAMSAPGAAAAAAAGAGSAAAATAAARSKSQPQASPSTP